MLLLATLALAGSNDYAREAEERMKLSFDLDQVQAELNAPAAAAPRASQPQLKAMGYLGGGVPAPPPLPLEPNSKLDGVVVLRDRAIVTRSREVKLDGGAQRVRFEGLPLGLDPSSLHAELHGGKAKVVGVELVSGTGDVEETERIAEIRTKAKELSGKLGDVRDHMESILLQRAYLSSALFPGEETPHPAATLESVRGTVSWLGDTERDLAGKLRADEEQAKDLGDKLEPLLTKLRDPLATGMTVRVDLDVAGGGPVDLALVYGVTGASWSPTYSARLDPDAKTVTLETNALVVQSTGEAWTDAALQLSTASPVVGGAVPVLSPWILDESGVDGSSLAVTGAASSGSGARIFTVEGKRTIAGDGSEARIPLTAQAAPTTLSLDTAPRVAADVFRTASVTWNGEAPLLPGEVASFVGGDYVGSAPIGTVAPGESLSLGFGVDDRIKVDRTVTGRTVEHLLGGRVRTTVKYKIKVHNYAKSAQTVRLRDQVPVSQVDQIKVSVIDPTLAPTPAPDAPSGVLTWDLKLAANAETSFEFGYVVVAPQQLQARMEQALW